MGKFPNKKGLSALSANKAEAVINATTRRSCDGGLERWAVPMRLLLFGLDDCR